MRPIVTLTLNAAIDVSSETERVEPLRKLRMSRERIDPGGGGINVSRVLQMLGVPTHAIFLAGGATGQALDGLLERDRLHRTWVRTEAETRMSLSVFERSTGREYRFVPEGHSVSAEELRDCEEAIGEARCDYLVASGSLPPGVDDDFYARLARSASSRGIRFVLDTSGPELAAALTGGAIFLAKPSREELEALVGGALPRLTDVASAATRIVEAGGAEHVAVTLGADGAMLVNREGSQFLPAARVKATSAVGAGDSFLAGLVAALAQGLSTIEALRHGVAAGAAAVLCPGTGLCGAEDLKRLLAMVPQPQHIKT